MAHDNLAEFCFENANLVAFLTNQNYAFSVEAIRSLIQGEGEGEDRISLHINRSWDREFEQWRRIIIIKLRKFNGSNCK